LKSWDAVAFVASVFDKAAITRAEELLRNALSEVVPKQGLVEAHGRCLWQAALLPLNRATA
jgi:hypothetical protein